MDDEAVFQSGAESAYTGRVVGARSPLSEAVREQLPAGYVAALESLAAGATDQEVAECAGVDPAAVPALVRLAAAKLLEPRATSATPK